MHTEWLDVARAWRMACFLISYVFLLAIILE